MATVTQWRWRSSPKSDRAESAPLTVIERRPAWQCANLRELWNYRELLFFLTWRDLKVRYRQTVLGVFWAVLQPLATMAAFALFLNRLGGSGDSPLPFALFVFAGLLPWAFVATTVTAASQSVVSHQNLITKVYFPRLLIPLGAMGAPLADLLVSTTLLVGVLLVWGIVPGLNVLLLPLLLLGLGAAALGLGTLLAALTVTYRDVRYIVPFLVQLAMFATPSIYLQAEDSLSSTAQFLVCLNPLNGLIAAFRQVLTGGAIDPWLLTSSLLLSLLLFLGGSWYFRLVERRFADII